MKTLSIITLFLFLQACATSNINPTPELHTLRTPQLQASVQVYVPKSAFDEFFLIEYVNQPQIMVTSGADLQAAALDTSNRYFSDVSTLSFDQPADFLLKFVAESSLSNHSRPIMTGNLIAQMLTVDGQLIYQKNIVRKESARNLDEHAYYNLYSNAVDEFLFDLFQKMGALLKRHTTNHQPKYVNIDKQIDNNILEVSSTGTGFFVNGSGNVITNHHVVEQCIALSIDLNGQSIASNVISSDANKDVAILSTDHKSSAFAYFNSSRAGERLGEEVMTLGYPLYGVLSSSLNLTTGNISSLMGVKDDENVYQISAPVQPGNSGGPVLNQRGLVAGVVQSKLNVLELSRVTGDVAQNVNFAIKSNKVQSFLSQNGITYHTRSYNQSHNKSTVDIAEQAKAFTVQIKCLG